MTASRRHSSEKESQRRIEEEKYVRKKKFGSEWTNFYYFIFSSLRHGTATAPHRDMAATGIVTHSTVKDHERAWDDSQRPQKEMERQSKSAAGEAIGIPAKGVTRDMAATGIATHNTTVTDWSSQ